jgi:hypothetical protein
MKQARAVAEAETETETGRSQRRDHLVGRWFLWEVKGPAWVTEVGKVGNMMGHEETWLAE